MLHLVSSVGYKPLWIVSKTRNMTMEMVFWSRMDIKNVHLFQSQPGKKIQALRCQNCGLKIRRNSIFCQSLDVPHSPSWVSRALETRMASTHGWYPKNIYRKLFFSLCLCFSSHSLSCPFIILSLKLLLICVHTASSTTRFQTPVGPLGIAILQTNNNDSEYN